MNAQYKQSGFTNGASPNSSLPSQGYRSPVNNFRPLAPFQSSHLNGPVNQNFHLEKPYNEHYRQGKDVSQQELLVMTIDLGNGKKDMLKVFDGDNPFDIAKSFCERHNLNPQLVEPLAQNIYGNIEQVLQETVENLNVGGGMRGQLESASEVRQSLGTGQQTGGFRHNAEMIENQDYEDAEYEETDNHGIRYLEDVRVQQSRHLAERIQNQNYRQQEKVHERDNNQGKHYPNVRETTNSKRYDEEADMYEMMDHDENNELIAERIRPFQSPGNRLTEKDLNTSKSRKEEYIEMTKNSTQRFDKKLNSAFLTSMDNEKKRINSDFPTEPKIVKPWVSREEFNSEEEYLDYLINSQYGNARDKQLGRYDETFVPHINQTSKQLIEQRPQSGKANVHERLYNEFRSKSIQRNNTKQNQSSQRVNSSTLRTQSTQGTDINYGTLLYHRGVKKNEELKRGILEKKKEKLELQQRECTFKPEINPISQQIMSTKARVENLPEMLIQTGKETKDRLERARSAKKLREIEECTFRPEVNFISQRIDSEKRRMNINIDQDRCLRLYQESKVREEQQELALRLVPAACTFQPSTNSFKGNRGSNLTFEQRDQKFRDRMERINYLRQLKEETEIRDPETGEPLFKPKTGRAPKIGVIRNTRNLPIGDYLYNQQYKIAENKRRLFEDKERSLEANRARSNETSQLIVENLMKRRLEEIFRRFDSDGDGYISSAKIDITQVGIEVLETLAPILCEMEERNQIMDFEVFYEQTERLFRYLTVTEKDKILLGKREPNYEPQWSFQPEIDKRSERIAQRRHPYGDFRSLYNSYIEERRRLNERLQDEQERKIEEELRECSFKPKIFTSPKGSMIANTTKSFVNNGQIDYFPNQYLL